MIGSLLLLIVIPAAIYLNTFYILKSSQKDIDTVTQSKAILAENIANLAIENSLNDPEKLNDLIHKVMAGNDEVKQFEFMTTNPDGNSFRVIASSEEGNIGKDTTEIQNILAWNQGEGIAFLGTDGQERLWKTTKVLKDDQGQKIGLISLAFSLADSDSLINSTIDKSYLVMILTMCVVLLLVANNTRLFGYAITLSKLEEVDKMKDTFISMSSHELRSPLAAIKGYLEFFNDKNKGKLDKESAKYLGNISLSVNRLDLLVDDILDVSKLEGNHVPFEIISMSPQAIITKSIEGMRPQAIQKNLDLVYLPTSLPRVKADAERVEQILINLISNAIKYTMKGKVQILTEATKKELLITVADTGLGISAQDIANLFEKFYRVKSDETKDIIGTGLGLWIAREIARKMKGDITVESIKGVGSHFTLHLPLD
jgi:signal transduction histidine kinase